MAGVDVRPVGYDITMFVYNDVRRDARVLKEAHSLVARGHDVTIIGRGAIDLPAEEEARGFTILRTAPPTGRGGPGSESPWRPHRGGGALDRARWILEYGSDFRAWSADALRRAAARRSGTGRPTAWHGHDLTGLVPAASARRRWGGRLIYDSHELYLEAGSAARLPSFVRRAIGRLEGARARSADRVITVNDTIALELARRYRLRTPAVVMNCPPAADYVSPERSPLRSALGVGSRPIVLHHGGIAEGRGIRQAVRALEWLPDDVALVVLGDGELVPDLRAMREEPRHRNRLFLLPAVSVEELPAWVAGADIGLVTFEAVDLNNYYASPNKLFEYLVQGIPAVVSDFPELRRVVAGNDVGITCDPAAPESVAAAIRLLLEESADDRKRRRERCRAAAVSTYSWERQEVVLLSVYDQLNA